MGSLAHTRSYGLLIPSDSTSYNFRLTSCTFHVKGCWPTYFLTWMSRPYHDEMELFRIPELALHILGQCETYPQLIALALTCTNLYLIWQRNKAYLIWAIGLQSRPAFNDALMAVGFPSSFEMLVSNQINLGSRNGNCPKRSPVRRLAARSLPLGSTQWLVGGSNKLRNG